MAITEATGFAELIKEATDEAHRRAERTPVIGALAAGKLPVEGFTEMLAQHYFFYEALEQAAEVMRADPVAGPFVHDELTRLPALARDLAALIGPDWRERITPGEATLRYCARIHEVCFDWAGGFVAHHYTRYLGDLSGGQILRTLLNRHLGLTEETGLSFYRFPGIPKAPVFKAHYRRLLDDAPWDADEQRRIAAESRLAFELNTAIFEELGARFC
ncbi:biliverdin-producing heme oxygenase [Allokutzneria sp. A3M-2-11 16]|uniref:biliverdin-producing heme oxygenase n=1 Tax=Allokutzneria sp. A3M-2-11 16 TaxID=2962043 RepID=UPI0020B6C2D7|nr:biliverdin-producing heme oxygenase [Allokutzneria sp. A3M-2-11 16]MCP3805457.1 biliverdin-producing heme oxygenase [Allokutzneria sp. A3M-2-11 16]